MKHRVSLIVVMLGLGLVSLAQAQVEVAARGSSNSSASADARGVSASQSSRGNASLATRPEEVALAEGTELSAELTRRVDLRRAEPGDEISAELTEAVESNGRIVLPKGTRLVGRLTAVERPGRSDAAGAARAGLGIAFETAMIGRNREIPLQATIQAVAAAEGDLRQAGDGVGSRPQAAAGRRPTALGGVPGGIRPGGGLVGSASGAISGGTGSISGAGHGAVGSAGSAGSRLGGRANSVAAVAGEIHQSPGAIGGPNAVGRLTAGSRGVFGLKGLDLAARTQATASAVSRGAAGSASSSTTMITSATGNVRLGRGTQMLLSISQSAQAAGRIAR